MKNLCENLGIRRYSLREMCTMSLLVAITVLLAIYATFRVGGAIKVPMKFVSVFITGALFGPLPAALTGLLGDILNAFLVPVGPPLPQISLIEFISGFIYGFFFYKKLSFSRAYFVSVVLCVLAQGLLDTFVTSFALYGAGYFPSYVTAVTVRFPATVLKAIIQSVVLSIGASYLPVFNKIVNSARSAK